MFIQRVLLISFVLIVAFVSVCQAKEWRGIVPLRSTRADVERLLGKPNTKDDRYLIENEEADVFYSKGLCANGWNVPKDTVIFIGVTFKQGRRLGELNLDLTKYQKVKDPLVTAHTYYMNKAEGIYYTVFEGLGSDKDQVLTVYYEPTSDDELTLRCAKPSKQSQTPESLAGLSSIQSQKYNHKHKRHRRLKVHNLAGS